MQISESMLRGIGMTSERTRRRLVERLREAGISDPRVLEVMLGTPRHLFVDEALASRAYEDTALPIGHGQTISQPYTVARMTELLLAGGDLGTVLEVGTGCGYQTCVLAQFAKRVYTVERIEALLAQARKRFRSLRLSNVRSRHADGQWGWPESGPYDAILVAAAPEEVPRALLEQLAPGGRMVLPLGTQRRQHLALIRHTSEGFIQEDVEMASFVPLLGGSL